MKKIIIVTLLFALFPFCTKAQKPRIVQDDRLAVSFNYGASYRLGKLSDDIPGSDREFYEHMKWGHNFNGDAVWYFNDGLGLGLKGSCYKNTLEHGGSLPSGVIYLGGDYSTMTYIAPEVSCRVKSGKNAFVCNVGFGYLDFGEQVGRIQNYPWVDVHGATIGCSADIKYERYLFDWFSVGIDFTSILGKLRLDESVYHIEGVDSGYKIESVDVRDESLCHYTLSIGLAFHLF